MASDRTSFSAQVNSMTLGDKKASNSDIAASSHMLRSATHPDFQGSSSDNPSELVGLVDELLHNLSKKFDGVSSDILAKMDEMSRRIDALEANIMAGNAAGQDEGGAPRDA